MSAAPPSPEQPVTGGCLCGAVRYEITAAPIGASYCHCTRCQRRTGTAASANVRIPVEGFRVLSGAAALRAYEPPDGAPKVFCTRCGSAVYSGNPDADAHVGVRIGGLDGDPGVRPEYHQFVDYAASWEPLPDDGLPRYGERRG